MLKAVKRTMRLNEAATSIFFEKIKVKLPTPIFGGKNYIMYFDTLIPNALLPSLNPLTAQTSVPLNTEFVVGGYDSLRDGGGGTFMWIPVQPPTPLPLPDDGGIILYAADPNGYFKRIFSGPINVRWFGAKGDGS